VAKRKVGVMIESFRLGVRGGIEKAAEVGADGFQIFCTEGEMRPDNMDAAARRDFVSRVKQKGLVISALCADNGRGFFNPETNPAQIAFCRKCVDLAVDLGTDVITTHFGHIPADVGGEKWDTGVAALTQIGKYAEKKKVRFASETGLEEPALKRRFIEAVGIPAIRANYDPANLVMNRFDHLGGVSVLGPYIVHTHAKDAKLGDGEVALGEGDVDFPKYLAALDAVGFTGFLTIERECGDDPVRDIAKAVEYLRRL
jgi:L-ribulose-5-phosphate 3-epimerase